MSFLNKRIKIDTKNTNKAHYRGDLIHMDLFFLKRPRYTSPNPDQDNSAIEYIQLVYVIVIDAFTRYCNIVQLKSKADNQGIKKAFVDLLDTINPEGPITTIYDRGREFFHLQKNYDTYTYKATDGSTISIPIKHLWSKSRYGASIAEGNIGVYKKKVANYVLDRKNPYTKEGQEALLKEMNERKMIALDGKTPTQMLEVSGQVEDFPEKVERSNISEPYQVGDLVVLRHYIKGKEFTKNSSLPNFDPEIFFIDRVIKLPTGTYRYHLRALEIFDARKKFKDKPKHIELFSQISFQHGELIKLTPSQVQTLLSFAENDHLLGSYQSQEERDLYFYDYRCFSTALFL